MNNPVHKNTNYTKKVESNSSNGYFKIFTPGYEMDTANLTKIHLLLTEMCIDHES